MDNDSSSKNWNHMAWRETLVCLLAVVTAASASGAQSQRVRSGQEILTQLEQDWDRAFHRRDVAFIEPSQGRALAVNSRYVDVFVLRAGRWQCMASHSARVAPPA